MNKFSNIVRAWVISLDPSPEQQEIAESRINICDGCELKSYNKFLDLWYCGGCNCPLKKKIYTSKKEDCPKKIWIK